MKHAHDAALEQAPNVLNAIGVNVAIDVPFAVIDGMVRELGAIEPQVGFEFIGVHGASRYNMLTDKASKHGSGHVFDGLQTDLTRCSLSHSNYGNFIGGSSAAWTFAFAAYIGFVSFDDPGELLTELIIFRHSRADAVSHVPRRLIGSLEFTFQLSGAHAFLRRADHIDCEKPLSQRQMRIVKHRPRGNTVLVTAIGAMVEMPRLSSLAFGFKTRDALTLATDTAQTFRPAHFLVVGDTLFFGVEAGKNLEDRRLFVHGK